MPHTEQTETHDVGDENNPTVDPTPEPVPPAPASPPAQQPQSKIITMPSNAVAKIRREERERGREDAKNALMEQALTLGYDSVDEMMAAARAYKQQRPTAPEPTPRRKPQASTQPKEDTVDDDDTNDRKHPRIKKRYESEIQRMKDERRRINRARARSDRQVKELRRKIDAQEAETELRIAAARAGVKDVDYALHVLKRDLKSKTQEELGTFDEAKYFTHTLRQTHPYLFEATAVPATTSPDDSGDPPPPDAEGAGANGAPPNGSVDATKMSRQEYIEHLRKMGINDPSMNF